MLLDSVEPGWAVENCARSVQAVAFLLMVHQGSPCRVPVTGQKGVHRSCLQCAANASRAWLSCSEMPHP